MFYTKADIQEREDEFIQQVKSGAVFIYPTDTIYGIGCDATNAEAVKRIRQIKQQNQRPLSVISPSLKWLKANCSLDEKAEKWMKKLPGPYTLILRLKKKDAVSAEVTLGTDTLGIRVPNHWLREFLEKAGVPIVTTSVNITGMSYLKQVDELPKDIEKMVDFVISEGILDSSPSALVNLVEDKVIERPKK